jgi:RNA polymerase sigma factor (sigma-70 family)
MRAYRCQEIARLEHELRLAPLRHRLRQVAGALKAIELIEPEREYPYSFVCYQITGYRTRRTDDVMFSGESIVADLVHLLDVLTAENPLPVDSAGGRLHEAEDLAKRFNVSTKTISRWRDRGLAGCWYWFDEGDGRGRPRLAFTDQAVECFAARNAELVRRGAAFAFMSDDERQQVVARARELVAVEKCGLHAATLRIAEETGRAVETIRYTLRAFDRRNPEEAVFDRAEQAKPIDEATVIHDAYVAGEDVRSLATRFRKTQTEIRRLITTARASRLTAEPIPYMYNELFDAPNAERLISDAGRPGKSDGKSPSVNATLNAAPNALPVYLSELYRTPLLDRDEEQQLFRRMNYLLHRAELTRQKIAAMPALASNADVAAAERDLAAMQELLDAARSVKNRITQANLRLVVSIAKRHARGRDGESLFELVSDGNLALIRAVEKFDFARGFRFSTYASWALMRSYARSVPEELTHAGRFQTGHDELLADARDHREPELQPEAQAESIRATVRDGLAALNDRERAVVERHFGLAGAGPTRTLEEIGRELSLSKERVRQIEMIALRKLRDTLGDRAAALLAG